MKKIVCLLAATIYILTVFSQSNIDIQHYRFRVELNDNNDTVYGQAEMRLKFLQPANSFSFDLILQKNNGKGMKVDSITGAEVRDFMRFPDSVRVLTRKNFGANDTTSILISYHGVPGDGLIISKNKYGHRTFFADNWPYRAHHWIPCVDNPADKAPVEFIVTAPSHYQVISNGIKVEETDLPGNKRLTHWKEDVPLPTKVMVIGVADFAVNNLADTNCVAVSSWVFPENREYGFYDYAPAREILAFFANYIGPYPFKKLANVQSKTIFGGMENAGAIFYFENSVTGRREEESLMAHEIVHQWFGNMATEKSFTHLWLSEGFATYLTHLFIESRYGTDSMNHEMKNDRETVIDFSRQAGRPVVDPATPHRQLLNPNSYQKGGWVLHMLRRQLGDSVFHLLIRTYYDTFKGINADTEDLKALAEKISGRKLNAFFLQWLYTAGQPDLSVQWKYLVKEKKLLVTVDQLQKNILFNFPLEISIITSGKPNTQKLNVTKASEIFSITIREKPLKLELDPNTSLLFEATILEKK